MVAECGGHIRLSESAGVRIGAEKQPAASGRGDHGDERRSRHATAVSAQTRITSEAERTRHSSTYTTPAKLHCLSFFFSFKLPGGMMRVGVGEGTNAWGKRPETMTAVNMPLVFYSTQV